MNNNLEEFKERLETYKEQIQKKEDHLMKLYAMIGQTEGADFHAVLALIKEKKAELAALEDKRKALVQYKEDIELAEIARQRKLKEAEQKKLENDYKNEPTEVKTIHTPYYDKQRDEKAARYWAMKRSGYITETELKIWEHIRKHPGEHILEEIAAQTGIRAVTVGPRLSEMKTAGLIKVDGYRGELETYRVIYPSTVRECDQEFWKPKLNSEYKD